MGYTPIMSFNIKFKKMSQWRILYLFFLGVVFWVSSCFLGGYIFMEKYLSSKSDAQTVNLNPSELLSSIKASIQWIKSEDAPWQYEKFSIIWDALVSQYYDADKLNFDKMIDSGLKGFVEWLEDPYTVYFNKTESETFQQDLKGEANFEWIGAVLGKKKDGVVIEEVMKWFPAYKAWIKQLDMILEINWKETKDMTVSEAVSLIKWPAGTEVELTLLRNKEKTIDKIKVTREKIVIPSVSWKTLDLTNWKKAGYINISVIWQDTEAALKKTIQELQAQNVSWIILDLRWNGWGYLPVAVDIASHFIPKGKLVVTAKYRSYPSESYKSFGYSEFESVPMIVLVDAMTASASEIIAAALKDQNGATIVWTKTFGKWSIQTVKDFEDGVSLKYTVWKWYTPKDINIDHEWLTPDVQVVLDQDKYLNSQEDTQLQAAQGELEKLLK